MVAFSADATSMTKMGSERSFIEDFREIGAECKVAPQRPRSNAGEVTLTSTGNDVESRAEIGATNSIQHSLTTLQILYSYEWFRLLIIQILIVSTLSALAAILSITFISASAPYLGFYVAPLLSTFTVPLLWSSTCVVAQLRLARRKKRNRVTKRVYMNKSGLWRAVWYVWFAMTILIMIGLPPFFVFLIVYSISLIQG